MGFARYGGNGGSSRSRAGEVHEVTVNDVFGKHGVPRLALRRALADTLAERARRISPSEDPFAFGLTVSVALHIVVLVLCLVELGSGRTFQAPEIVYSVTLEGGKTLGGIAQVARQNSAAVAPPKNVSAAAETAADVAEPEVVRLKTAEVKNPPPKKAPVKAEPVKKKSEVKPVAEKAKPKPAAPTRAEIDKDYQKAMQRYLGESTEAGGQGFGAGRIGGSGMGGGVLRPPEFFTYRQVLRDSIRRGWKWYDSRAALVTQVTFDIAVDGTISNVAVSGSSGNDEFDQSVLRAVYKASPLPPPPTSVYSDFRSVRLSFDPRE